MRSLKVAFFVGGLGLLGFAIWRSGVQSVISPLLEMRGWFLLALLATVPAQLLRTLSWRLLLGGDDQAVPFARLWRIRLAGEALNYLSVAGPFLGDPAKVWLLSPEAGGKQAAKSVTLDRILYSVSGALFLLTTLFLLMVRSQSQSASRAAIFLLAGIAVAASPVLLARFTRRVSRSTMYAVVAMHLVSHLFMVLEIAIIFKALHLGATVFDAFSLEVTTKGVNTLFFFVPMQVGVLEGGYAVLLRHLNLGATIGLTVGLARRLRSLVWSGLGVVVLWKSGRTPGFRLTSPDSVPRDARQPVAPGAP